jgi:transposase-like protein
VNQSKTIKKCRFCNYNGDFKEHGFKRYNLRYECPKCGSILIDKDSEKFEGYPEWIKPEEFYSKTFI